MKIIQEKNIINMIHTSRTFEKKNPFVNMFSEN